MAPRPYVFVNMAMTADGKIDTAARRGARISSAADTARVDELRAGADAVMVGARTLLAEDPGLSVRDPALVAERVAAGRPPQPMKVGVASRLQPPGEGGLPAEGDFLAGGEGPVVLLTTERTSGDAVEAFRALGAEVKVAGSKRVDLAAALQAIASMGVKRLMVEGGGTLVAALLEAELVDELQLAVAPLIFGGVDAPTPVDGPGRSRGEAIELSLAEATIGADGDVVLRYLIGAEDRP